MDLKRVQNSLIALSLADHLGDVNNEIPLICEALCLDYRWSDKWERYVFPWEEGRWNEPEE